MIFIDCISLLNSVIHFRALPSESLTPKLVQMSRGWTHHGGLILLLGLVSTELASQFVGHLWVGKSAFSQNAAWVSSLFLTVLLNLENIPLVRGELGQKLHSGSCRTPIRPISIKVMTQYQPPALVTFARLSVRPCPWSSLPLSEPGQVPFQDLTRLTQKRL